MSFLCLKKFKRVQFCLTYSRLKIFLHWLKTLETYNNFKKFAKILLFFSYFQITTRSFYKIFYNLF